MNLTDSQKQLLTSAIIALVITVGALLGYTIKITPATPSPATFEARAIERTGILCTFSLDPCVDSRGGRDINVYSDADAATSTFLLDGATGNITGKVLQYATPGSKVVCGTQTITGTGAIAHGLATPQYVNLNMAQDATGDGARLTYTNSSATVVAKAWNSALTPAAATTPVAVSWCVVGVP